MVSAPALAPVPVKPAVSVGSAAFEVTVMLPESAPDWAGVNVTLNLVLCPDASVRGSAKPLTPNPVPETAAAETRALVPPLFVRVTVWL